MESLKAHEGCPLYSVLKNPTKEQNYRASRLAEASKSCRGCALLLKSISTVSPGWPGNTGCGEVLTLTFTELGLMVHLRCSTPQCEVHGVWIERFSLWFRADDPVAKLEEPGDPIGSAFSIVEDSGSDAAFERISAWLADCVAHHECGPKPEGYMPSRLIDLEERRGDGVAVLVDFTDPAAPPAAPYACLSYCWGPNPDGVVRTIKGNLEQHQAGIPTRTLPKTVQDAALVCQRLGIRYLWVDALCIVQDNAEDWAAESARMCDVYSGSHITIAAHRAKTCQEGFLGEQRLAWSDFQLELSTDFGELFEGANPEAMIIRRVKDGGVPGHRARSPLQQRGWTLQEGILPSRIVHFTHAELAWECNARHFCECGHVRGLCGQLPALPMDKTAILREKSRPWAPRNSSLPDEGWMTLAGLYAGRNLTYFSDKLTAMLGLAQMVQARIPGTVDSTYVAGIFTSSLPRQLLWYISTGGMPYAPTRPSTPQRIPTWSWASVNSPMEYDSVLKARGTEEVHARVEVYREELLLVGLALPVQLKTVEDARGYPQPFRRGETARMRRQTVVRTGDGSKYEATSDIDRDVELLLGQDGWDCWDIDHPHAQECSLCQAGTWDPDGRYYLVKVASYERDSDKTARGFVLLLQRSESAQGAWERLGIVVLGLPTIESGQELGPPVRRLDWGTMFRDAETREFKVI